jgi:MFS family permease
LVEAEHLPDLPELGRPDAGAGAPRRLRLDLGPLRRSRDLRLLCIGSGVSFAGSMMTFVALPYQAYQLSRSSLIVGLLSVGELAALLVTALLGGALADAWDRRRMVLLTESATCVVTGLLVLNALLGSPRLWALFVISFVLAGLDGLQRPSFDAMVPRLVPPEDLAATSAVMSVRTEVGMIGAPALAGVLIASIGLAATYGIDLASFAVSLVAIWMLRAPTLSGERSDVSLRAIRAGLGYAWARRDLLGSYLVDINAMFFGMPLALFPQVASHLGGAKVLGLLYAAPAAGALVVTVSSGWTRHLQHYGRLVVGGALVWGAGIVLFGLVSTLWMALIGLAVAGAGDMASGIGRSTMWNQSIPEALRGRLAGVEMLSYSSGPTLGNVESGLVESFAGLRTSIVSGGVACIVGTGLLTLALPAFWHYRASEGMARKAAEERPATS